ncbi:hypothetical protein QBC47DRAFT_305893 [Echria macrotheca]|uniref:Rhodopsin domain-containing protein n=1 Tax=Echria macrotheca TaxID=438768 RepID=A0AAJ0F2Q6_9PEZI|nr:hypothetical protein QBC47DRAFT_305893 [Echria macrotheca]
MADVGAGGPPPESLPGYNDDRSGLAIFCVVFCLTVSTVMVGLRTWTRKVIINKMGMDDWAAIITMIITWGEGISIAISTKYGLGRHIYAVQPPTLIPMYWKMFWVTLLLYHAGLLAAKMTFLLQYYRILAIQRMRIVYIVAIVIVGLWGFAQVLIALLICRPIQGLWDKTIEADCMPNAPQIYVNAAGNIITDITIFLLPMPAIKHLNLRRNSKIMLFGIFSLGFFTVAISVVRVKFLDIHEDVTWQHVESSGWSIGELASAITCAALPTLRPFVAKYLPGLGVAGGTEDGPRYDSYYPHTVGGGGGRPGGGGGSHATAASKFRPGTKKSSTSQAEENVDSFMFGDKSDYELRMPSGGRGHSSDGNTGGFMGKREFV